MFIFVLFMNLLIYWILSLIGPLIFFRVGNEILFSVDRFRRRIESNVWLRGLYKESCVIWIVNTNRSYKFYILRKSWIVSIFWNCPSVKTTPYFARVKCCSRPGDQFMTKRVVFSLNSNVDITNLKSILRFFVFIYYKICFFGDFCSGKEKNS